jgi:quinolinate synthase
MAIEAATVQETYQMMRQKLARLVPDVELRIKAELVYEINRRKRERGAIILGHNYMEPVLFHTVPDVVGDSLELSRRAAETDAPIIIFCGVRFMAETAKILNPTKTVLLPAKVAGCSLASSITADDVRALKKQYPGVPVVSYINTYADVKAESDIICTSGNAHKVVQSLPHDTVIFLPDEYLASNVARECGKKIVFPSRATAPGSGSGTARNGVRDGDDGGHVMIGWHGRCEVHEKFTVEDIRAVREQFPGVQVVTHPECSPEVVAASDISASTSRMADFVKRSSAPHFLILTECSMADNIIAENPEKDVLRLCSVRCPHMNEITLEDTLNALINTEQVIEVPAEVQVGARRALQRMLEIR